LVVLGAIDLSVLFAGRALLQVLRGAEWSTAATTLLFPEGLMGGWGSVAAVVVGLVAAGAYASEERWASFATVLKGVTFGVA